MSVPTPPNPLDPDMASRLDPVLVEYHKNHQLASRLETHQVPLEVVRKNPELFSRSWASGPRQFPQTTDYEIPTSTDKGISFKVRVYQPNPDKHGHGPFALHLNFHGGGWVFGGLDSDALICDQLRDALPLTVVDVDYRLCPETEFGGNIEDGFSALLWARENTAALNIEPSSVSIGGVSAGAHIACVLQQRARHAGIPLRLLIAAVPPLADHDLYQTPSDSPWPSFVKNQKTLFLDWYRMKYFSETVFRATTDAGGLRKKLPEWWISPLRAPEFSGLCETLVLTAECDILRDEGEAYARKLAEAGVKVTIRRFLRAPHSFMYMKGILKQADWYMEDLQIALSNAHRLGHIKVVDEA